EPGRGGVRPAVRVRRDPHARRPPHVRQGQPAPVPGQPARPYRDPHHVRGADPPHRRHPPGRRRPPGPLELRQRHQEAARRGHTRLTRRERGAAPRSEPPPFACSQVTRSDTAWLFSLSRREACTAAPAAKTRNGSATRNQPSGDSAHAWVAGSTPSAAVPDSRPNRDTSRYTPSTSPAIAAIGATSVFHVPPPPLRRKYTITATETRISTTTMASTASALNQVNRCTIGSMPVTVNSRTTSSETAETVTVPTAGAERPFTRPSPAGSTPARASEKTYRAALFWNAS